MGCLKGRTGSAGRFSAAAARWHPLILSAGSQLARLDASRRRRDGWLVFQFGLCLQREHKPSHSRSRPADRAMLRGEIRLDSAGLPSPGISRRQRHIRMESHRSLTFYRLFSGKVTLNNQKVNNEKTFWAVFFLFFFFFLQFFKFALCTDSIYWSNNYACTK